MPDSSFIYFLPWLLGALSIVSYIVGITVGILAIQALRKYLRE